MLERGAETLKWGSWLAVDRRYYSKEIQDSVVCREEPPVLPAASEPPPDIPATTFSKANSKRFSLDEVSHRLAA
jgi:hypothetical protein